MSATSSPSHREQLVGGVVIVGAILGIASMIDPADSVAIPSTGLIVTEADQHASSTSLRDGALTLGFIEGRGYEARLIAAHPEALVTVSDAYGYRLESELSVEEFLLLEPTFVPDATPDGHETWPEAFMDVDVPMDAW